MNEPKDQGVLFSLYQKKKERKKEKKKKDLSASTEALRHLYPYISAPMVC
jgi:hypothetical protein